MTELPVPDGFDAAIDHEWSVLARPGPHYSGPERVAIAETARLARDGNHRTHGVALTPEVTEVARVVSVAAHEIRGDDVDRWESEGLDREAYVEVVGVVSRLTAVDTALRGLGRVERALPDPIEGEPTRAVADGAKRRSAWVPTVGAAVPPTVLTAAPGESEAQEALHGALYLTYEEMGDLDITKGLHRTQLELAAARTSLLNECFF